MRIRWLFLTISLSCTYFFLLQAIPLKIKNLPRNVEREEHKWSKFPNYGQFPQTGERIYLLRERYLMENNKRLPLAGSFVLGSFYLPVQLGSDGIFELLVDTGNLKTEVSRPRYSSYTEKKGSTDLAVYSSHCSNCQSSSLYTFDASASYVSCSVRDLLPLLLPIFFH